MKTLESLMERQHESDEVIRRYKRLSSLWSGLGVVYIVAVWAMVFKP